MTSTLSSVGEPRAASRLPRLSIRLRLTFLYGALVLLSGVALVGITYLLVGRATGGAVVGINSGGGIVLSYGGAGTAGQALPPFGQPPDLSQVQGLISQAHDVEMTQLLIWSSVALVILAVASLGIGWIVAGRVLDPLRAMTADVRAVSATSLHRRLPLTGPDDELSDLGGTFNDLLARLERSFESQRSFVANASHELRTPLARQRTVLQVALDDPDATADSLREAANRALVAGEQQERLIEALLALARSERGPERRASVDLAATAHRVIDARRSVIEESGIHLVSRLGPTAVSGDPRLLEHLIANLVDNAIRYNEPDGWVEVATGLRGGMPALTVVNSGPTIPEGEVERLFEPFHRSGAERTGQGDGWGIGLSIVRAIAIAHDAHIDARARPEGGLVIEIRFPMPPVAVGVS